MKCTNCGAEIAPGNSFCVHCGATAPQQNNAQPQQTYAQPQQSYAQPQQSYATPSIPLEYRPISAWGYVGYMLLYAIPLIGFIVLLINALGASNVNVKSFARSYFCILLIYIVLVILMIILFAVTGLSLSYYF